MKAYKNRHLTTSGMTALISCFLLFSCNNDDLLDNGNNGHTGESCDYICFGMSPGENVQTRGNAGNNGSGYTSDRFVLRSDDPADTLCVRAIVSDGISSSVSGADPYITRSAPVTKEDFYNTFHVLAYWQKDGTLVDQFYINDDVTDKGSNRWSTANPHYWPGASHTLQFYAWAPTDVPTLKTPSTPGTDKILTYTVPDEATAQKDIVVATTNEMPGNTEQVVGLTFQHLCTAVRFEVGSQMPAGTLQSISLKNVLNSGSYNMAGTGDDKWNRKISTSIFTQTLNKEITGNETPGSAIIDEGNTFMMLPQTLPADAEIEVVFRDGTTGNKRTLTASIANSEWPQGKTVTYKLSITPEYDLEFISTPELQDAHYIIYPIHIKAGEVPGGWTMTSKDPSVTLRTDLTVLQSRGYWIGEDRGEQSIQSNVSGDDITVYAFLEENVTDSQRDVILELRPTNMPNAQPQTFTISQLCPSWNGDLGCERIEDGDYPWGFLWDKDMTIKYTLPSGGNLGDIFENVLLNFYLTFFDRSEYITIERVLVIFVGSVTFNFNDVPDLETAIDVDDGRQNTLDIYNFEGISDASALMAVLEQIGATPDKTLPTNPTEFAARACVMKNKYSKEVTMEQGQTVERAVLKEEDCNWYLPARNEVVKIKDDEYPLQSDKDYWTSTVPGGNDNEHAYKYTSKGATNLEIRSEVLHVRAVRKKP